MAYDSGLNGLLIEKERGAVGFSGKNKGFLGKMNGPLKSRQEV